MKKTRKRKIIIGVGIIALILILIFVFRGNIFQTTFSQGSSSSTISGGSLG